MEDLQLLHAAMIIISTLFSYKIFLIYYLFGRLKTGMHLKNVALYFLLPKSKHYYTEA